MNNCLYYKYSNTDDPTTDKRNLECKERNFDNINNLDYSHNEFSKFIDDNYDNFGDLENPFKFTSEYITQTTEQLCNTEEYSLKPQQKLLGQIINPNTNIKNLLIYHGLGSGKTCTGLVIGQAFTNTGNKNIFFIVPAALKTQYYDEIIGELRNNKIWSCTSQCVMLGSNNVYEQKFYTTEREKINIDIIKKKIYDLDINIMNNKNSNNNTSLDILLNSKARELLNLKRLQQNIISKVNKVFNIMSHDEFINSLMRKQDDKLILKENLQDNSPFFKPNCVMIIDEIQNLVSETGIKYKILYTAIKYYFHPEVKKIFLTATPIYDNAFEYALTLNLLNPRISFPSSKQLFFDMFVGKIVETTNKTTNETTINVVPRQKDEKIDFNNASLLNKDIFRYISSGYVSYFKGGNPNAYPYKRTIELFHEIKGENKIKYIEGVEKDATNEILRIERILKKNQGKLTDMNKKKITDAILLNYYSESDAGGILPVARQTINVAFDNLSKANLDIDEKQFNELKSATIKNSIQSKLKNKSSEQIMSILDNISIKIKSILEYASYSDGPIFVYSNWLSAGIETFATILEALGYKKFPNPGEKRYFAWSPSLESDQTIITSARNTFNSPVNVNGSLIKFMLGTSSIKEGVSFKNVSQVHILDPWWNNSRIDQVTARAIRLCSHKDLEEEKRYVDVFKHYAIYPSFFKKEEDQDTVNMLERLAINMDTGNQIRQIAIKIVMTSFAWTKLLTIDQKILEICNRKDNLNYQFMYLIKQSSIDCNLFKNGNLIRLEEHIRQISANNFQLFYRHPSDLTIYLRDEVNNILTSSDIINRTYSYPINKQFKPSFTEAEYNVSENIYLPLIEDSLIIVTDNTDLVLKEDINCWKNDNTIQSISNIEKKIRDYFINLGNLQLLMPDIRKFFLIEEKDEENSGIKFSVDENLKKRRILRFLREILEDSKISQQVKNNLKNLISGIKVDKILTFEEKITRVIIELQITDNDASDYYNFARNNPTTFNELYKKLFEKQSN